MQYLSNALFGSNVQSVQVAVPKQQLLDQSLQLSVPNKRFADWTKEEHAESYQCMQKIAKVWCENAITEQYLVYGKVEDRPFNWEMTPHQKSCFGRVFQQLQVLWRVAFGGAEVSETSRKVQHMQYNELLEKSSDPIEAEKTYKISNDPFCKIETIERQWVVKGKNVNVLFSYAPIGFGGERLHFLIIPSMHRSQFTDVTKEEYTEALEFAAKLVNHFTEERNEVKTAYLMHKTGKDAGQTVMHWHLQVIFSSNPTQDFLSKLTVVKNILLGSSRMSDAALKSQVDYLRYELANLNG